MKIRVLSLAAAAALLLQAASVAVWADEARPDARPLLSPLFTNNMVLQRGMADPIWGWTNAGQKITVSMEGKTADAVADANGKWMARLGPFQAGGPYKLTVTGPQTVTLDNVLVGDVWVCSGQSNMEMGIGNVKNAQQEIADANQPEIRLFTVPKSVNLEPQQVLAAPSQWLVCSPANVSAGGWNGFSAVAYFFGRDLYQALKVPIGLIHTSWGGTVAEAWTSGSALDTMADFRPGVAQVQQAAATQNTTPEAFDRQVASWWSANDPGSGTGPGWADPALDTAAWQSMTLPAFWENAGLPDFDGVVWFRKAFDLPADAIGKDLTLHLGPIDDRDTTWVNGVRVGGIDQFDTPRNYTVPATALKEGRNVIAVRVLDTGGNGGFGGKPEQMYLEVPGGQNISLAGPWSYKVGVALAKTQPMPIRIAGNNPNIPTVLYNGMIAPLIPYGIKGAIWYQGESNAGRAYQYRTLLPTMIKDWRSRWGEGNFPFFIVQLANFMGTAAQPGESAWAELREAQSMTARSLPKSAIATAIDIGDAADIHPKNKQDLGKRLSLDALAVAYGQKVEYSGPTFRSMKREGNAIRIRFDHLGGGLVAQGDKLQGFAIAGPDKHFVWADARVDGDSVLVSSPQVSDPAAVRYAWGDNPVANLYNKAGLPALPFRTDQWPGTTVNSH